MSQKQKIRVMTVAMTDSTGLYLLFEPEGACNKFKRALFKDGYASLEVDKGDHKRNITVNRDNVLFVEYSIITDSSLEELKKGLRKAGYQEA